MPISWRPSHWDEIEPGLSMQPKNWGDDLVGRDAATQAWKHLARSPSFGSVVVECEPAIGGHRLIGIGAAVFVSRAFADAELAAPRPGLNSRMIAGIHAGRSVLASWNDIGRANAREGSQLLILCGSCLRYEVLSPFERDQAQNHLSASFAECYAGYRLQRILCETNDEYATEALRCSGVFQPIARFPEQGRVLFQMTRESAAAVSGSLGNVLFNYREPVLHLRESDQELLLAALDGATDQELATKLKVTFAAVKARWRSTFARVAQVMPDLVADLDAHAGRGIQKRHRVLAYVRTHPEELRPYEWTAENNGSGTRKAIKIL